jgi:2-oxoglutarate dehydrogenase E1 component
MSTTDNFANGTSAVYVDMLYDQWKENPNSVHASWRSYFDNVEKGE